MQRLIRLALCAMVVGGYVAAWIRRGAADALAILITLVVVAWMITMSDSAPFWFQVDC